MRGRKPDNIAEALTFARMHGDKAASKHFKVSVRTLRRYRSKVESGVVPELAAVVRKTTEVVREGSLKQLKRIHRMALDALEKRLSATGEDRMKDFSLLGSIKLIGDQILVVDELDEGNEEPGKDNGRPASGAESGKAPAEAPRGTEGATPQGRVVPFTRRAGT